MPRKAPIKPEGDNGRLAAKIVIGNALAANLAYRLPWWQKEALRLWQGGNHQPARVAMLLDNLPDHGARELSELGLVVLGSKKNGYRPHLTDLGSAVLARIN